MSAGFSLPSTSEASMDVRRPEGRRSRHVGALALLGAGLLSSCAPAPALRVALPSDLDTLDPHLHNNVSAYEVLSHVYEPLVRLDRHMRPTAALATSWQSPDSVHWVFRLRPGVRFHDGTPLTARDVVESLQRPLGDESLEARAFLGSIAEVAAVDDGQVALRTRWANGLLASRLHFVLVVPRGSTAASLAARPNGTGPYRVAGPWKPGEPLRLRRHAGYWGPRPAVDGVELQLGVRTAAIVPEVEAGRFGLLHLSARDVLDAARRSGRYVERQNHDVFLRHLGFDLARARTPFSPEPRNPFLGAAVREALDLALDREALARAVSDTAEPAWQLVPRAVLGHDPSVGPRASDRTRARRLLAEAGYPRGFEVVLHRPSGFARAAHEVARQLGEAGLRVTVESLPSAEFFRRLDRRELSFWISASGCATGDGLELLENAFHSPDPSRGLGGDNHGGFSDAALDERVRATAALADASARQEEVRALLGRVLRERAWIPLYHDQSRYLVERRWSFTPRADDYFSATDVVPARP